MAWPNSFSIVSLLVSLAAAAAPRGEVGAGAATAEVTVRGAAQPHLRLGPGSQLAVRIDGPAAVRVGVRLEKGLLTKVASAVLDVDGKVVAEPRLPSALEPDAASDRGLAVGEAVMLEVAIAEGAHQLGVGWPADAPADLLVSLQGLDLTFARDSAAAALPLPAAWSGNKAVQVTFKDVASTEPVSAGLPVSSSAMAMQPAPLPAALATPPAIPVGEAIRPPDADAWSLMFLGGAESSGAESRSRARVARLGFEATRTAFTTGLVVLQVDWRLSEQTYGSGQPGSPTDGTRVDEQRFDLMAGAGYDFARLLQVEGLTLAPVIGLKYLRLDNRAFPTDLLGIDLTARVRYALFPAAAVHANLGWVYNLVHPGASSAAQTPLSQLGVRAGLDFPLGSGYALALDYQGDVLAFDSNTRVAHGAALGFGRTF